MAKNDQMTCIFARAPLSFAADKGSQQKNRARCGAPDPGNETETPTFDPRRSLTFIRTLSLSKQSTRLRAPRSNTNVGNNGLLFQTKQDLSVLLDVNIYFA